MVFKTQQQHQQFLSSFFNTLEENFPRVKQVITARQNQCSIYSAIKVIDLWQRLSHENKIVELGTGITTSIFLEYFLSKEELYSENMQYILNPPMLLSVDENEQYQNEFKQILYDIYGQRVVDKYVTFIIRDVFKDDANNECSYIFMEEDKGLLSGCDFLYIDAPNNSKLDGSTYICVDSVNLTKERFINPETIAFDIRHESVMFLMFHNINYKIELGNTFDGSCNSNHHSIARRNYNAI